ncbi:MAG: hypothetical protein ACE366_02815 [Bradymonadia bacterium]
MKTRFLPIMALFCASSAAAGGWTQPAGDAYLKVWHRSLVGNAAYTADGEVLDLSETYIDQLTQFYGEVGLTDQLTLVFQGAPVGYAAYGDESTTYVGATGAGLRSGIAVGKLRLAVEGRYSYAPDVGEDVLAAELVDDVAITYVPTVETHAIQGDLQAGYPLSFGWVTGNVGYRWHSREGLDAAIVGFAQLGWQASKTVQADVHFNLWEPLGSVEVTNVAGAGQTRYLGLGFGGSWWLNEGFALNAGLEGVVYAESNAATPTLTLGVEHRGSWW